MPITENWSTKKKLGVTALFLLVTMIAFPLVAANWDNITSYSWQMSAAPKIVPLKQSPPQFCKLSTEDQTLLDEGIADLTARHPQEFEFLFNSKVSTIQPNCIGAAEGKINYTRTDNNKGFTVSVDLDAPHEQVTYHYSQGGAVKFDWYRRPFGSGTGR